MNIFTGSEIQSSFWSSAVQLRSPK